MQISLFILIFILIFLFLLSPAFGLRRRLVEKEKEAFAVIDGSTFWSSRWGKVKVYGAESPREGEPEYTESGKVILPYLLIIFKGHKILTRNDSDHNFSDREFA